MGFPYLVEKFINTYWHILTYISQNNKTCEVNAHKAGLIFLRNTNFTHYNLPTIILPVFAVKMKKSKF